MKIIDINWEEIEVVRKKCIVFSKDGKRAVQKYKNLLPLWKIEKFKHFCSLYIEFGGEYIQTFSLWEDMGDFTIERERYIPSECKLQRLHDVVSGSCMYGMGGFEHYITNAIEYGDWINMVELEALKRLGKNELLDKAIVAREVYRANIEKKEEEERKEREQKAEVQKARNKMIVQKKLDNLIENVYKKGEIHNEKIEVVGKEISLILYTMKDVFDIKIPVRTQGWINQVLGKIKFVDGRITYTYNAIKGKDSKVFITYLAELEKKINLLKEKNKKWKI